jgi:hypothetical protein
VKKFLPFFLILAFNGSVCPAVAQEANPASEEVRKTNLVPYKVTPLDSEVVKKIWMGANGDDSWWHSSDNKKYAEVAKLKNDRGQDVLISMWVDRDACADMTCPVQVIVAGEKVFDDHACRFDELHTVSGSRNSLFLCDFVIPLRTAKDENR